MAAKLFRIFFFFLILIQVAGICYRSTIPGHRTYDRQVTLTDQLAAPVSEEATAEQAAIEGILFSPENLTVPDALLVPIPSFQFGTIEILASVLFVLFSLVAFVKVREIIRFFTISYFHTLFSSIIQINAP